MAARVKNVHRPLDPEFSGSAKKHFKPADRLHVLMDLDDNGRRLETIDVKESDEAGLITEFTTGTATTILNTGIGNVLAAKADADELSTTQAAYVGTLKTFPAP